MKKTLFATFLLIASGQLYADEDSVLRTEFESLKFLAGWCWAGTFPDGIRTDIHCYEPVYGGQHLRDRHVVTGGTTLYHGETIYSWDKANEEIAYVYWNSYGDVTRGTAAPHADYIAFPDESYTASNGDEIRISSVWENLTEDSYDSLSVESFPDGEKKERRVRYEKRPFASDPLEAE